MSFSRSGPQDSQVYLSRAQVLGLAPCVRALERHTCSNKALRAEEVYLFTLSEGALR